MRISLSAPMKLAKGDTVLVRFTPLRWAFGVVDSSGQARTAITYGPGRTRLLLDTSKITRANIREWTAKAPTKAMRDKTYSLAEADALLGIRQLGGGPTTVNTGLPSLDKKQDRTEHDRLNKGCRFPAGVAGYWRATPKKVGGEVLPFPVPFKVEGYKSSEFLRELSKAESAATKVVSKGTSNNRWTGEINGAAEFTLTKKVGGRNVKFSWPDGYRKYLRGGVPPSQKFYKFITGLENKNLPAL